MPTLRPSGLLFIVGERIGDFALVDEYASIRGNQGVVVDYQDRKRPFKSKPPVGQSLPSSATLRVFRAASRFVSSSRAIS
jgi:hypothetical protein